jgi:hypothetical protein
MGMGMGTEIADQNQLSSLLVPVINSILWPKLSDSDPAMRHF